MLKNCEDALDRLYNSGRFLFTLEYLTEEVGISPFDLFNDFGNSVRGDRMKLCDYAEKSNGKDISFRAEIHYLDDNENIIDRAVFSAPMDYGKHSLAGLDISKRKSDVAIVEVYFDNILMYANKLNFNMEYLL